MKKYLATSFFLLFSYFCYHCYEKYQRFLLYPELSVIQVIKNQWIEGVVIIPQLYFKAAVLNQAEAKHELAQKYRQGRGFFNVDCLQFIEWNIKAAKQNYAPAQFALFLDRGEDFCSADISHELALDWLVKAAQNDYLPAKYKLGKMYKSNSAPVMNLPYQKWVLESKKSYLKLAQQGDAHAQYVISKIYLEDFDSTDREESEREKWLIKAGEKGDFDALTSLAFQAQGWDDRGKAYKKFTQPFLDLQFKKVEEGDNLLVYDVANRYRQGMYGLKEDANKANNLYLMAAEKGEPVAILALINIYKKENKPHNLIKIQYWTNKYKEYLLTAVDSNSSEAIISLAYWYRSDRLFPKNEAKSLELLIKASELGSVSAMLIIANMYLKGEYGVVKDVVKAEEWFLKAIESGYSDALIDIGLIYQNGDDKLAKDTVKAEAFFNRYGNLTPYRAVALANMYAIANSERGFPQDLQKSFYWYLQAAEKGVQSAQLVVSRKYKSGIGVVADPVKAEYWLKVCCSKPDWDYDFYKQQM